MASHCDDAYVCHLIGVCNRHSNASFVFVKDLATLSDLPREEIQSIVTTARYAAIQ